MYKKKSSDEPFFKYKLQAPIMKVITNMKIKYLILACGSIQPPMQALSIVKTFVVHKCYPNINYRKPFH